MLRSCVCRYDDFLSPWYREWAIKLGLSLITPEAEKAGVLVHRKHWEYCAVAQALHERALLEPGRTGCGFAVGREPLPAAFAARGAQILATDQSPGGSAESWAATGQHVASLDGVYVPGLISRPDFDARVRFKPVDMRNLELPWAESFDFIWSCCSLEHLGSLEAGWQFVLKSLELVKPGGFAVHTTEFNVASNKETLENGESVIYRRKDIEDLDLRLRAMASGLCDFDFFCGDDLRDVEFDYPPYYENGRSHIKLLIQGHVATSCLLIIRKGSKGKGVTVWDSLGLGNDAVNPSEQSDIEQLADAAIRSAPVSGLPQSQPLEPDGCAFVSAVGDRRDDSRTMASQASAPPDIGPAEPRRVERASRVAFIRDIRRHFAARAPLPPPPVAPASTAPAAAPRAVEPSLTDLRMYPGYRQEDLAVFDAFDNAEPRPAPGFVTDFIGSRSRISSLWDGVEHLDGLVLPRPIPADHHSETVEWLGVLRSVLAAKGRLVAMELGAGMAPWLVVAATAARLRGITDIQLVGVEADPGRFALMAGHLRDNGLDPGQHRLFQAAVGVVAGAAKWPRLADPRNAAGARPVRHGRDPGEALDADDVRYLGPAAADLIDVNILAFDDLLRLHPQWDLVHIDVQGGECDLCRSALRILTERVRYLVVGTHSRKLDGDLIEIMFAGGWVLEHEKPARMVFNPGHAVLENMTTHDGTQVWRNPAL